jgi:predicted heme/steroid binding protein
MTTDLPVYTKSQLALRNGQDKPEVWIAYKGLIYDVTRSRLWRNGKHYEHWAGQDLTHELGDAPHDEWVFQNFDAIGKLAYPFYCHFFSAPRSKYQFFILHPRFPILLR